MMNDMILAILLVLLIIAMLILLIMSPTKTFGGGYKKFVEKYRQDEKFREFIDDKPPRFEDHIKVTRTGSVWINPKDVVKSDGFQKQLRVCKELNEKYPYGFTCNEFGGQIRGLRMKNVDELNYCVDCGGFMEYDDSSLLMCSPPKVRGRCTNEECNGGRFIRLSEYEKLKDLNKNANG